MSDVTVLIPDEYGTLCVVDASQLLGYLEDGDSLAEAIENSAIDSVEDPGNENFREHVRRIQALNDGTDPNADDYWGIK